jgi:2-oxoglutarate ferredoxin oxidoreductase subunit alpha
LRELNLLIGGPQGGGVESGARVLLRALLKAGYEVYGTREYFSNIKGKHSYFIIRVSEEKVGSARYPVDLVTCFDAETLFTHMFDVSSKGGVIVDSDILDTGLERIASMERKIKARLIRKLKDEGFGTTGNDVVDMLKGKGVKVYSVSYSYLLKQVGEVIKARSSVLARYLNTTAIAVLSYLIGLDLEFVKYGVRQAYSGKEEAVRNNEVVIDMVSREVGKLFKPMTNIGRIKREERRFLVSGNDAAAMGKLVGGLRFQTYYPITPAADESLYIEQHELLPLTHGGNAGVVVVQTEDEIAAVNMAIGAALTGVRAATSTSGPGFSLMAEGLGWAGINEVPVVITYYQRGGPSTGLPTRHSQSDLRFALYASHGEFPRIVIASGDLEEAFYDAIKAFNYAERYQLPVIHLLDKALANSLATIPIPKGIRIDRGKLVKEASPSYERFAFTDDGISPRASLGSGNVMWYTGDEHDEIGRIAEDSENRMKMYEKRMKKLSIASKEIPQEDKYLLYGQGSDTLVISWGSPKGAILDALKGLKDEGVAVDFLYLHMFLPFPDDEVKDLLSNYDRLIGIEGNYEAQAMGFIRERTGIEVPNLILKYTGRPIFENEVVFGIKKVVKEGARRVVLSYGV